MESSAKELERILEDGISSYPDAEPLAGLEERIVARVRTIRISRHSGIGLRSILVMALAGFILVVSALFFLRRNQPQRTVLTAETRPSNFDKPPVREQIEERPSGNSKPPRQTEATHRKRVRSLPKQESFPTPALVTPEERSLRALVTNYPDEAVRAFASLRQRSDEPIQIAPIVIPPLQNVAEQ